LLGLAMHAYVGDVGQPPGGGIVEMLQGAELPAAQQVSLDIMERPLALPLRLGPVRSAGPRPKTVVGGESQEARVVDRLVVLVTLHHYLEVVVQAGGGHAAQVREGGDVLAQRRLEVLSADEAHILTPRIT